MPKVSVILPLYNKERYVRRALESIARQSFSEFEVIIVDDGSTDSGGDIASDFTDERFRLIRQSNAGPGAARNRGIREASGDLIAFLDADDEWLPDYLRASVAAFERHDVATVTSAYLDCPGDRTSTPMWLKRGLRNGVERVNSQTSPELFLHMVAFMTPCTTVSRASTLRKWDGFWTASGCRYSEDALLWLKVLLNERVLFDLTPRVRIHRDASGLSKVGRSHPLEPFLENPGQVQGVCPPALQPLLESFYTIRAFKTACVWSYWGQWREARALRSRYRTEGDHRLPFYWASLMGANPLGAAACALARTLTGASTELK